MKRNHRNLLVYSTLVAVLGTTAVAGTAFANTLRQHASSSASGGVSIFDLGSSAGGRAGGSGSVSGAGSGSVSGSGAGSVGGSTLGSASDGTPAESAPGSGSVAGSGSFSGSGSVAGSGSFSGSGSVSGSTSSSVSGSSSAGSTGSGRASTSGAASAQARAAFSQLSRDSTRLYQAITELNTYPHFGQAMQNASQAANNLAHLSKTLSASDPSNSGIATASSQLSQIASKLQADVQTISFIVKPGQNGTTGKAPNLTGTQASEVRAAIADMRSQFGGLSSVESQLESVFAAVDKGQLPMPITHPPLPPFPIWPLLPSQGGSPLGSGSANGSANGGVSGAASGSGNGSVTITTPSGSGSGTSSVTVHLPGLVSGPYQPLQTTQATQK